MLDTEATLEIQHLIRDFKQLFGCTPRQAVALATAARVS